MNLTTVDWWKQNISYKCWLVVSVSTAIGNDTIIPQMTLIISINQTAHNTQAYSGRPWPVCTIMKHPEVDLYVIEKGLRVSSIRSHHGSLLFSQSKHSNYRRCQSLSDVASVINPAHWTQDIRHEHTYRGVKSSHNSPACCSFSFLRWDWIGNPFCVAGCCFSCYFSGNICPFQPTEL